MKFSYWIYLSFIKLVMVGTTVCGAEDIRTTPAASNSSHSHPLDVDREVKDILLEGLPGSNGSWEHSVDNKWTPVIEEDMRKFLDVGLKPAKNTGSGWAPGFAICLNQPMTVVKMAIKRWGEMWFGLSSVTILISNEKDRPHKKDDWEEVATIDVDGSWTEGEEKGFFEKEIGKKDPHLWWGFRFNCSKEGDYGWLIALSAVHLTVQ